MVSSNLDNPLSLQIVTWSFSLGTVVLGKCYRLSRGRDQMRRGKLDYIRSDSGGGPLTVAVTDIGWVFSCARNWTSAVFT